MKKTISLIVKFLPRIFERKCWVLFFFLGGFYLLRCEAGSEQLRSRSTVNCACMVRRLRNVSTACRSTSRSARNFSCRREYSATSGKRKRRWRVKEKTKRSRLEKEKEKRRAEVGRNRRSKKLVEVWRTIEKIQQDKRTEGKEESIVAFTLLILFLSLGGYKRREWERGHCGSIFRTRGRCQPCQSVWLYRVRSCRRKLLHQYSKQREAQGGRVAQTVTSLSSFYFFFSRNWVKVVWGWCESECVREFRGAVHFSAVRSATRAYHSLCHRMRW